MPLITRRYVHDVAHGSNLDFLLRAFIGAANRFADRIGGGLQAIALALATPQDNSAQVQAEIDKTAAQIRAQAAKLKTGIDSLPKGDDNG